MKYEGYSAKVEYDDEARLFHGEVIGIKDVVTFQGSSVDELERAFHESVDDYLHFCRERGEEPDKPYSGRFNVRLTPALHEALWIAAKAKGQTLNTFITRAIESQVSNYMRN